MSENFGRCKRCEGTGIRKSIDVIRVNENTTREEVDFSCLGCDGTGRSADAMDYYERDVL